MRSYHSLRLLFILTWALITAWACDDNEPAQPPPTSIAEATADQCPSGGWVIWVGGESYVVCNGAEGADGNDGNPANLYVTEADSARCPNGGYVFVMDDVEHVICHGNHGEDGRDGRNTLILAQAEEAGEHCLFGGLLIITCFDDGAGECEAESASHLYVCHGAPGADGAPAVLPEIVTNEASLEACPYGGSVISIDTLSVTVCHGATGAQGEQGEQGVAGETPTIVVESADIKDCPHGGTTLIINDQPAHLCNGAPGAQGEAGETPQVSVALATDECPYGGVVFTVNGLATAICNGAPGEQGVQGEQGEQGEAGHSPVISVTPATLAECPHGGSVISIDGSPVVLCNGAPGEQGEQGEQGEAGHSPVISVTPATLAECPHGGSVISIDGSPVVLCNGAPGAEGEAGHSPVISVTPATLVQCPYGGSVISIDGSPVVLCNGAPGAEGAAGHSPVITVAPATLAQCAYGGFIMTIDGVSSAICTPHCVDADGDGHFAVDPVYCVDGDDFCDADPDNWTAHGCAHCVDNDGDGFGTDCDRGADCDDNDTAYWDACPPPSCEVVSTITGDSQTKVPASDGRYLYVVLGNGTYGHLRVYDMIDPAAPVLVGSLNLTSSQGCWYANRVRLSPDNAYLYVYSGSCTGGAVVDVRNPAAPVALAKFSGQVGGSMDLTICGETLYTARQSKGVAAYDISNPAAPVFLAQYDLPFAASNGHYPYGVTCYRHDATFDSVYLGDNDGTNGGLWSFDFNKSTGAFSLRQHFAGVRPARGAALSADTLYVSGWTNSSQLAVLDTSDKYDLVVQRLVSLGANSNNQPLLVENRLFAVRNDVVAAYDLSEPTSPTLHFSGVGNSPWGYAYFTMNGERYLSYGVNSGNTITTCKLIRAF